MISRMLKLNAVKFTAEDIGAMKTLLESKEGVSVIAQSQMSGVWFHDENWEMELRLLLLADLHLTVSRVIFRNKRKGTMTELLKMLEAFCVRNQVKEILVQSVETPEMAVWCRKNGFVPDSNASFMSGEVSLGDYRKKIINEAAM